MARFRVPLFVAVSLFAISAKTTLLQGGELENNIRAATAPEQAQWHVVMSEIITSNEQQNWTDVYNATVKVYRGETLIGTWRGSTLPNFRPGGSKPADWTYAVVKATCSFRGDLNGRYYTWRRGKRVDGRRPCLRLAPKVPTANLSSLRQADLKIDGITDELKALSIERKYQYATAILVHSGYKQHWRGSAGCLTIHPDDAAAFFAAIPEGVRGTLAVNRGIEDEERRQSYCY